MKTRISLTPLIVINVASYALPAIEMSTMFKLGCASRLTVVQLNEFLTVSGSALYRVNCTMTPDCTRLNRFQCIVLRLFSLAPIEQLMINNHSQS